jgi:hypothetical protein
MFPLRKASNSKLPTIHLMLAILVVASAAMQNASASNCSDIRIDIKPNSLNIAAWLDKGDELNGDLRITSKGGDVNISKYKIFSDELIMDGGIDRISSHNIKVLGLQDLKRDMPLDIQVNISGLKEPGTYHGNLTLLYFCGGNATSEPINLTVIARTAPALTSATSKLSLQLVNTGDAKSSTLAGMLLPKSYFQNQVTLKINNTHQVPITLKSASLLVEGGIPGNQFAEKALSIDAPNTYSDMAMISVPLKIDRWKIPPDHYTGWITLLFEGQKNPVSIPVDMKVRNGPGWAIFFLLIGILVGKLYQKYQDSGKYQAEALEEIYHLRSMIMPPLNDTCDEQNIKKEIDGLEQSIHHEKWDQAKLNEYLLKTKNIRNRIDMMARLEAIKTVLNKRLEDKVKIKEIKEEIAEIDRTKKLICLGQDDTGVTKLKEIEKVLPDLLKDSPTSEHEAEAPAKSDNGFKLHDYIDAITGQWNLYAGYIFYLVLIIGLLIVGLQTLYINEGSTFGANPFSDYVKVFTWGLAGEIASKTLTKMTGS